MEIEDKFQRQLKLGEEIDKLRRNFKKDSSTRKTEDYLKQRLQNLEALWAEFSSNNEELIKPEVKQQDHKYFTNKYFQEAEKIYKELKQAIQTLQAKFTGPAEGVSKPTEEPAEFIFTNDSNIICNTRSNDDDPLINIIRKQKAVMQTTAHLIQEIENRNESAHPRAYYIVKIDTLQQLQTQLRYNHQLIWEYNNGEIHPEYDSKYYLEMESWLQDTIVMLYDKREGVEGSSYQTNKSIAQASLPKITLPTFDGKYLLWVQFRDLYTQLIHQQPISDAQKMFYLTSHLGGEARKLIQHLPVCNENYEAAWSILCNRYDNQRLLVTSLLNKFLSQSTIQSESSHAIKTLHDITMECMLGLNNLGISTDSWDSLIVQILMKKVDKTTLTLYEQSLKAPRELNSLKNVLEFLETRFQSLEAITGRSSTQTQIKATALAAVTNNSHNNGKQCIICKLQHPLHVCETFKTKSIGEKYDILKKHNRCINCLKAGHIAVNCSSRSCSKCNKRHNTLLHRNASSTSNLKPNQPSAGATPQSTAAQTNLASATKPPSSETSVILAAQSENSLKTYVLLGTVKIKVVTHTGKEIECRAILDSGSQSNFITDRLANRLSLKQIEDPLDIQGIGQSRHRTSRRCNILIKSKVTAYQTNMEAHILPQIIESHPMAAIDISHWNIPTNIPLADPDFHQPGRVDLLIGAENFYQLLTIGQIKLKGETPTLQNTVFGWVVSGKAEIAIRNPKVICNVCTQDEERLND